MACTEQKKLKNYIHTKPIPGSSGSVCRCTCTGQTLTEIVICIKQMVGAGYKSVYTSPARMPAKEKCVCVIALLQVHHVEYSKVDTTKNNKHVGASTSPSQSAVLFMAQTLPTLFTITDRKLVRTNFWSEYRFPRYYSGTY